MKIRSWTTRELHLAVAKSFSIRQVLLALGLKPAGGNYDQIKRYITHENLDTSHFLGQGWNITAKNLITKDRTPLESLLIEDSTFQSYKLKNRLFKAGLKKQKCESCDWSKMAQDGRIPVELHHINSKKTDNRLENLKILCPNCHSLEASHRGRNIGK